MIRHGYDDMRWLRRAISLFYITMFARLRDTYTDEEERHGLLTYYVIIRVDAG